MPFAERSFLATRCTRWAGLSVCLLVLLLFIAPGSVFAGERNTCAKRKANAHDRDLSCRKAVSLIAVRQGKDVVDARHDFCDRLLTWRFERIERQSRGRCETTGDATSIGLSNMEHTAQVFAQLGLATADCPEGTTSTLSNNVIVTLSTLLGDRIEYSYPNQPPPGSGTDPVTLTAQCGANSGSCGTLYTNTSVEAKYQFCYADSGTDDWPTLKFDVSSAGGSSTQGTFSVDPNTIQDWNDPVPPASAQPRNILLSGDAYGKCADSCVEFPSDDGSDSLWVCPGVQSCP